MERRPTWIRGKGSIAVGCGGTKLRAKTKEAGEKPNPTWGVDEQGRFGGNNRPSKESRWGGGEGRRRQGANWRKTGGGGRGTGKTFRNRSTPWAAFTVVKRYNWKRGEDS